MSKALNLFVLAICSLFWLSTGIAQNFTATQSLDHNLLKPTGLVLPQTGLAQTGENIMKMHDACISVGSQGYLKMEILNEDEFTGFQFDLPLASGLQYIPGSASLNPGRSVDHIIQANMLPGTSILRAISFSITNAAFLGNDGIIATFTVIAPSLPGVYALEPENAIITNAQGVNIITGIIGGSLTNIGCYHLVEFIVQDENQVNISGATITLGNYTNGPGYYFFTIPLDSTGWYDYQVTKAGYYPANGTVWIDNSITVHVTLEAITENENIMKINDVTGMAGENIVVELEVINDDPFVAIQCDIPLPQGFGYIPGSVIPHPARKVDHLAQGGVLPGTNILRIISFSLTNAQYLGNSGTVVMFSLSTPIAPGIYELFLENAIISSPQAENIITGTINGVVTLDEDYYCYTVVFYIYDYNGNPITDATISLCGITNEPGNYVFCVPPGTCAYLIVAPGYQPVSGSIFIIDEDLTIALYLYDPQFPVIHVDPESIEPITYPGYISSEELTISNNGTADLEFDIAIEYAKKVSGWLSLTPVSGIVAPGEEQQIILTINATGLETGIYEATLQISSNDPENPLVTVSVTLYIVINADGTIEPENAHVFPIPANDWLIISNAWDVNRISLSNLTGQKLYERQVYGEPNIRLDVRPYHMGVYLLQMQLQNGQLQWKKLIIKN